ncbi:MAG: acetylxylan esterase, partial [Verrucomicrobiota bacterium]|nr:acetylxylan esterase [Verrucomicrobiota bacterium]
MEMEAQPKGYLYDDEEVLSYDLPDLLLGLDGKRIRTAEDWATKRRPEILRLFEKEVFGRSPK